MIVEYKISEDFIEEVRQRADIVEIISEHVHLKRTGKNYQGLCPFHSEKTPSFNVNPQRQMFYCFGCQTGGNVFSFLMKKENLPFIEALQVVADKVGMELPRRELSPQDKKKEEERRRWQEIHQWALHFFHDVLLNRPEGQAGRQYFQRRGIDEETMKKFRLGFAPDKWDGLLKELNQRGVSQEELAQAGLVVKRVQENTNSAIFYDRFRNRVIFSILDVRSVPIAFGGRVLDDSLPKYLNSPENRFFTKGNNLYGLNLAARVIREAGYALLLEGYMDVIAVHKAGFSNAVASLGTALTKEQAKLLKRYTSKVMLAYDSDDAGIQAALRAGQILIDQGFKVEILTFEDAKDADEFLTKKGTNAFKARIDKTLTFVEFRYRVLTKDGVPGSIPDKAELIRKIASDIKRINSAAEREGYERFLSLELGLTLEAVQEEIHSLDQKTQENKGYSEYFSQKQDISVKKRNNIKGEDNGSLPPTVPLGIFRAEQIVLRLILEDPQCKNKVLENLGNDFWRLAEHKYIFDNYPDKNLNYIADNDQLYEQIQKRLAEIYEINIDTSKAELLLSDCVDTIRMNTEKETVEELQARMINLEKSGDMVGALAILKEIGERLKGGK